MRTHDQNNMVNKVHKNVKYMLSQAREIINIKNRIPITFKRNNISNEDISVINLRNISNQLNQSYRNPPKQERPKQERPKTKGRILKLRTSLQGEESSEMDKFQTLSKEQIKQLKLLSHLNKDQIQLVQTSRRSIKVGNLLRYNDNILPPISTKRIQRSLARSSKDRLQLEIQPFQECKVEKKRKFKTIESISSSNLIAYLQKHKKKSNPFSSKNKEKERESKKIFNKKIDFQYEPWGNEAEPVDVFFQL